MSIELGTIQISNAPLPTAEEILEAMKKALDSMPPEPYKTYMESKGCSPDDGWIMLLPIDKFPKGAWLPSYVRASAIAKDRIYFVRLLGDERFGRCL